MLRRVDHYIAATVARPMLAIGAILTVVFASFDTARTLADFEGSRLTAVVVAQLVGLKTLIALDVLLPLAFYLAVITGLAALHQRHETVALRSIGISPLRTCSGVLLAGTGFALMVAGVSLFGRPWAYSQVHAIESALEKGVGIDTLAPDHFQTRDGRVVYVRSNPGDGDYVRGVLMYERTDKRSELILAERGTSPRGDETAGRRLRLEETRSYSLDRRGRADRIQQVGELTWEPETPRRDKPGGRKAMATSALMGSDDPDEVAERQWRLSRPLATLLLALIAIPLSGTAPRGGPYARISTALALFVVYFVVGDMARSWVEQEKVPPLPGLWWPHAIVGAALALTAATGHSWRR